jgi:8-oxo-dGTP pyrophosphatase MutT (NUDIX family)
VSSSFHVERAAPLLHSYVFDVERRTIRHEERTFDRDVVTHQGAVAILALDDQGTIGLLRQYRAPFDAYLWEIPAGTCDVFGEDPLDTAKRELREELGCEASRWTSLGRFMVSPGWTDQIMVIYEACGLTQLERLPEGPEELASSVHWLSPDALRQTLRGEDAIDATLAIALHRVFGTFFDDA